VSFREALFLSEGSEDHHSIAGLLIDIASLACDLGDVSLGARLWGPAESLGEEVVGGPTVRDVEEYERCFRAAEARAGTAPSRRRGPKGKAMRQKDAVSEAFSLLDRIAAAEDRQG
jgi:hypothetical protein